MAEAARVMDVDRTTVLRRLAAFEKRLGFRLFHKRDGVYVALPEAAPIIEAARTVDHVLKQAQRKLNRAELDLRGTLGFSTTDSIYLAGISEILQEFADENPQLTIDLKVTTRALDIDNLETEVILRASDAPPDHLVGRRVCGLTFGIYGAVSYLQRRSGQHIGDFDWLVINRAMVKSVPGRWLSENVPETSVVLVADTFVALGEACRLGRGLTLLPNAYAATVPGIARQRHLEITTIEAGLWLLTHADYQHLPRVRRFVDFMALSLQVRRSFLES